MSLLYAYRDQLTIADVCEDIKSGSVVAMADKCTGLFRFDEDQRNMDGRSLHPLGIATRDLVAGERLLFDIHGFSFVSYKMVVEDKPAVTTDWRKIDVRIIRDAA